jgi:hypothetical protein
LLFDKSGGGKKANRAIVRGLILIFVGLVEGLFFGLNLLPIETATIVVLYFLARHSYKKAKKEEEEESKWKFKVSKRDARVINKQIQEHFGSATN